MPEATYCPRRAENPNAPKNEEESPDFWRESWEQFPWHWHPRACSYCGSLHPGDALRLLREGWTQEMATGKRYKAYLYPPADLEAVRMKLGGDRPDQRDPASVLPKLYVHHMSQEQIKELNEIHNGGPA